MTTRRSDHFALLFAVDCSCRPEIRAFREISLVRSSFTRGRISDTGAGENDDPARDPEESDDRDGRAGEGEGSDKLPDRNENQTKYDEQPDALDERTARARTESMTVRSPGPDTRSTVKAASAI